MNHKTISKITILGAGKLGQAVATGLVHSNQFEAQNITLTRRNVADLSGFADQGFITTNDNAAAVKDANLIILSVGPKDVAAILEELKNCFDPDSQILCSTVTGVPIEDMSAMIDSDLPIIRIMPNTAVAIGESMTCLATLEKYQSVLPVVESVFGQLGKTMVTSENLMGAATALCASGLAFFLRSVRAASQGGIEIGFHAEEAIILAAQTAKGAASLMIESEKHPEAEIDKVTTPQGITIAGLNEMEHQGFSSAMIKAIVTSANKIAKVLEK